MELSEKNAEARGLWKTADLQARRGEWKEAEENYLRVAEVLEDPRPFIQLGRVRNVQGDPVGAKEAFEKAIASDPERPCGKYYLALAQIDLEELDDAKRSLETVIERQPENLAAICLAALIDYRRGKQAPALETWKKSFSANTDFLIRLSATLEAERLELEKETPSSSAPSENENTESSGETAGPIDLEKCFHQAMGHNEYEEAYRIARINLQQKPRDPEANFYAGWGALYAGEYDESAALLNKAIDLDRRRALRQSIGKWKKPTRERVRRLRDEIADEPRALAMKGLALIRAGRPEEGRRDLSNVPVEGPESFNKYYYLGICALAENYPEKALGLFRKSYEAYGVDTIELCLPETLEWSRRRHIENPA